MALDSSAVGRSYPPTAPYAVGAEKVREFALAVGEDAAVTSDVDAARAAGYSGIVATPTFPFVLAWQALDAMVTDPDLGIDFARVVHGEQRFAMRRPLVAVDVVTGAATIEQIKSLAGNAMITGRVDISAIDGEVVGSAWSMLVVRAPEGPSS